MHFLLLFILLLLPTLPLKAEPQIDASAAFSHTPVPQWVRGL